MNNQEILVYVIELEQPFINWTGIWKGFQTINNVAGYYVENLEENLIKVDIKNVTEVDTNMPILDYVSYIYKKDTLIKYGLNEEESKMFISLLDKMIIPEEDLIAYNDECESDFPFETGMIFFESLISLKNSGFN